VTFTSTLQKLAANFSVHKYFKNDKTLVQIYNDFIKIEKLLNTYAWLYQNV